MLRILRLFILISIASLSIQALTAIPSLVNNQPVPSLAPMLKEVVPGVVNIATEGQVDVPRDLQDDPMFRRFYGDPNRQLKTQSLGSGVIVDAKNGYILTNNHVIAKATKITVILHDGRKFTAKVIGKDADSDIAVLQIKGATKLTQIKFGDSDILQVGDFVVAIGNPFGLGQTATSGIISALGRSNLGIEGYEDFIQTDAAINQGNSGGALVNLRGELVGINTAIISRTGGNIGIGFAIPVNMANKLMQQLVKFGEVRRGLLGVHIQTLTPELARGLGVDPDQHGALVTQVIEGSAAKNAGLESGDIITKANGKPVKSANDLRNNIGTMGIGHSVDITYLRDRRERTTKTMLGANQQQKTIAKALHPHLEGATITEIKRDSRYFGQIRGVQVADVSNDSVAMQNGLRKGDIVTKVNRQNVNTVSDFNKAVQSSQKSLLLFIVRGDGALILSLE